MLGMELKPEDRGWNDPPIVNFSDANQSHKRGKLLNKRVAFPIHGSNMVPNVGPGYSMQNSPMQNSPMQPIMPASQKNYTYSGSQGVPGGNNFYPSSSETYYPQQLQPNQYPQANTHPQSSFMPSGVTEEPQPIQYHQPNVQPSNSAAGTETMMWLEDSLKNFHAMMKTLSPHILICSLPAWIIYLMLTASNEPEKAEYPDADDRDEVTHHLQVMETMWRKNQLPPEVCNLLYTMSGALCQGDRNYAESLLSSISTNHFNCCQEWISGPSAILQAASSNPGGN